jgi:hypothetical protein
VRKLPEATGTCGASDKEVFTPAPELAPGACAKPAGHVIKAESAKAIKGWYRLIVVSVLLKSLASRGGSAASLFR